jgi:GAF domain-containing protein
MASGVNWRGAGCVGSGGKDVLVDIYLAQVKAGQGPLVEALWGLQTVLVSDTGTDRRWPAWATRVRELDVPLNVSRRTVGMLGLYSSRIDAFDTDDQAVAQILARHAACHYENS